MPLFDATRFASVCMSTKEPVPYVFFAMPAVVQACPNRAACWSPAMPAIGAAMPPNVAGSVVEMPPDESTTRGGFGGVTPQRLSLSLLPSPLLLSHNRGRDAVYAVVTWARPA